MPESSDCIIIGGGVVGLSIARQLAGDGIGVLLLDTNACGREASWAGAGIIAPSNPNREDPLNCFQQRSVGMYPSFCQSLYSETGVDTEYDRCGEFQALLPGEPPGALRAIERGAAGHTMPNGAPLFEFLSAAQAIAMEPNASAEMAGYLLSRQTAQVRNPRLLRALQASCVHRGVEIREGSPVERLLRVGDRVTGVEVDGEEISGAVVVLCAGAWSSSFCEHLQSIMPIHPVRGQMILLKFDKRPCGYILSHGTTYIAPRIDGHVLLGATQEHDAGFSHRTTPQGIASIMEIGMRMMPKLADAPFVGTWAGLRPGTLDDKPYLGAVPGMDGLIAATGHYRTGLTLAPVTAELVSATVRGESYPIDLTCCLPGRSLDAAAAH